MKQINETTFTSDNGLITFVHGDCMKVMSGFNEDEFDLSCVDPPYGINVNMNAGRKSDTRSRKRTVKKWDLEPPSQEYFDMLRLISKNQIIWGANHLIDKIKTNSQGWIFWDKCVATECSFSDGELAWTSFNRTLKKITVPWSGFIGSEGEKFHPTTKPIKLYRNVFREYAKPTDHILDTHGGSLNSAIAAHMDGFRMTNIIVTGKQIGRAHV